MTDIQKVIIAVLGAVVGHLLLLLALALFFTFAGSRQANAAGSVSAEPEEITVLISELLEELDLNPKEQTQQYARTDPDQESETKPEDARFHSDRNTLAATELPPDPKSDLNAPTIEGRDDLPLLELRNRKFVDGEFQDASAASAPSAPSMPTPPSPETPLLLPPVMPEQETSDGESEEKPEIPSEKTLETPADAADQPKEAPDANPDRPADAEELPKTPDEKLIQPDTENLDKEAQMAQAQESFIDPFAADAAALPEKTAKTDELASAEKPSEEVGSPAAPETPKPASAMPKLKQYVPNLTPQIPSMAPSPPQMSSANIPPSPKPAADTPAFTPETMARKLDGNIANQANRPSLDVDGNALGKYKKAVTQAIERKWHRYREKNAGFATYGSLKVKFRVDSNGNPKNLKLVKNEANAVMAEFTLRAVLDADIPKMPADVASQLGGRGLDISYDVIVY